MQYKGESKSEKTEEEGTVMLQVLGGKTFQVGLSDSSSRERDIKRERDSICGQTTKGTAKTGAITNSHLLICELMI